MNAASDLDIEYSFSPTLPFKMNYTQLNKRSVRYLISIGDLCVALVIDVVRGSWESLVDSIRLPSIDSVGFGLLLLLFIGAFARNSNE